MFITGTLYAHLEKLERINHSKIVNENMNYLKFIHNSINLYSKIFCKSLLIFLLFEINLYCSKHKFYKYIFIYDK